jgi:S1-C subfamily serine protease
MAQPATSRIDGILVWEVTPGSRAALAGLLPGDLVICVNGRSVRDGHELSALIVQASKDLESVTLSILRDGRLRSVEMRVSL